MVIVFGLAVAIHPVGLLLTFGLMVLLTSTEYIGMVKPGNRILYPVIGTLLIYFGGYFATQYIPMSAFLLFLMILCVFHSYIFVEIILFKPKRPSRYYIPGMLYITLAASAIHYFQYFEQYQINLFIVLALVWASDTGSYFLGKYFGRRPLAPSISPRKTVEGFIGGWLLGFIFNSILVICNVLDIRILIIALIVHILVVIGDLIESKLKRIAQVKDSGQLIPGHGGFLDRCDGLLFSLPFTILLFHYTINV